MGTLSPGALPSTVATHHRRPDIVLIVVDDLMRTTLPSYGASSKFGGLTPYLDRLLKGGTVFEKAYTTSAICTPSRLSLMTGRYVSDIMPTELFETVPRVHFDGPDLSNLTTLPRMLNGKGYRTGLFGKYHLAPRRFLVDSMVRACNITGAMVPTPEQLGEPEFLRMWNPFRKHGCISALVKQQTGFATAKEVSFDTMSIEELGHNPEAMAEAAADFVRSSRALDKPFFMYFAPTLTHSPLCYGGALLEDPRAVDGVPPEATTLRWKQQRLAVLKRLTEAGVLCPDAATKRRKALWLAEIASGTSLLADTPDGAGGWADNPTPITASATDPARHLNDREMLRGNPVPNRTHTQALTLTLAQALTLGLALALALALASTLTLALTLTRQDAQRDGGGLRSGELPARPRQQPAHDLPDAQLVRALRADAARPEHHAARLHRRRHRRRELHRDGALLRVRGSGSG